MKIGELVNLVVEKSNLINETNENELRIEHGKKDFNIEELLQDD